LIAVPDVLLRTRQSSERKPATLKVKPWVAAGGELAGPSGVDKNGKGQLRDGLARMRFADVQPYHVQEFLDASRGALSPLL
jgi:hypothetical protein